ncbi:MAG: RDD family protein [Flavobacteriaceae bacterium]|nr:RDD family protein [Flavobacteriaceae bacterium]
MNNFSIETSQNVKIAQSPAYLTDRIFAYLIDGLIIGVYIFIVFFTLNGFTSSTFGLSIFSVLLLPVLLYHLLFEIFNNGQSPGKNAMQIRVIKEDGTAPSLGDYLLRWILRLIEISSLSGVVAIISIVLTNKNQRLGDLAAKTLVVSEKASKASIFNFKFSKDYTPTFEQVVLLTDNDIQRIKNVFSNARRTKNSYVLEQLKLKLIAQLHLETNLPAEEFIFKILKDHYFITKDQ